jgi:hypothetical protein
VRMFRRIVLLAVALLGPALAAPAAHAGPPTEQEVQARLKKTNYARGGYYFGAEGFYAVENSLHVAGEDVYIGSGGFRLRVGHRHNRWWGTELQGQYVNTFSGPFQEFLAWGMHVNFRIYASKSRIQPFIMFGPGFNWIRPKDGPEDPPPGLPIPANNSPGFSAHFGAGAEVYWSETFAVTLQASYYLTVGNIKNYDFMTFGIGLQFQ